MITFIFLKSFLISIQNINIIITIKYASVLWVIKTNNRVNPSDLSVKLSYLSMIAQNKTKEIHAIKNPITPKLAKHISYHDGVVPALIWVIGIFKIDAVK